MKIATQLVSVSGAPSGGDGPAGTGGVIGHALRVEAAFPSGRPSPSTVENVEQRVRLFVPMALVAARTLAG